MVYYLSTFELLKSASTNKDFTFCDLCSDLRALRTFTASVCCSNGLKNTSQHLQWAQTQVPEAPPSACVSHTLFPLTDPNIFLGFHQVNPGHLQKGKDSRPIASSYWKNKKINKKGTKYASTSMYHMYTRALPPHIHLCEQDTVLQKFIKIYNLPRTASIPPIPCLELRLLYLYIKYTSPVKLLCWEHSGDFCTVRECPSIALQWSEVQELYTKSRAAVHRPSLHCTGGISGCWYSSRPPPGSAHSITAQRSLSLWPEVTHPQLKASSRGIAAECKVATRFPFGICLLQPSLEQSFPQGSRAAVFTYYPLSEGTTFWDTTLQFSDTCTRINIYLTRKGCNASISAFCLPHPCLNIINLLIYIYRIILLLGQGLLSLQQIYMLIELLKISTQE